MASGSPIDPSFQFSAVTPSNTAPLKYHGVAQRAKAFYVGVAGDVAVQDDQGTSVTFTGCLAGVMYPVSTQVIMATNTTATNIVALY